ncbi:hypothetical protein CBF23_003545 [Marinomonas agarivorans]|nr:hypothetical protein CBF23_003545 [Marinomonas agarivorans]
MNEKEIKDNLIKSRYWIHSIQAKEIKNFLVSQLNTDIDTLVLHHHFGQNDEYFTLMVNGNFIIDIEYSEKTIVDCEIVTLEKYLVENNKMPSLFRKTINIAEQIFRCDCPVHTLKRK